MTMLSILRRRDFRLLWSGQLVSLVGDQMRFLALPFYVYQATGSARSTGAMFMVQVLPPLLFGSLAGVLVERWDRRRTMIAADVLRALCLLPLLAMEADRIWLLYPVAFLLSLLALIYSPAASSVIPRLVDEGELVEANSTLAMSGNLARLIGPTAGGALLQWVGLPGVVLLDAASFLISAACISLLTLPSAAPREPAARNGGSLARLWLEIWRQWLEGLRFVKRRPALLLLFAATSTGFLGDSIITVLFIPYVKETLRGGALGFGWLITARGLGGLIGGLLVGRTGGLIATERLFSAGLLGTGLLLVAMFQTSSLAAALAFMALLGWPAMAWLISSTTLLQKWAPDEFRPRVFGYFNTTASLMVLLGTAVASGLGESVEAPLLLTFAGALFLVSGAVCVAFLRPPAGDRAAVALKPGEAPLT